MAYCGNVHFDRKQGGNQVDVIQAPRSTGSILKPFLYYAMLLIGLIFGIQCGCGIARKLKAELWGGIILVIIGLKTVSYTHLDVYKRQVSSIMKHVVVSD